MYETVTAYDGSTGDLTYNHTESHGKTTQGFGDGNIFVIKALPETNDSGRVLASMYAGFKLDNTSTKAQSSFVFSNQDVLENSSSVTPLGNKDTFIFRDLVFKYNHSFSFLYPVFTEDYKTGFALTEFSDELYEYFHLIPMNPFNLFHDYGVANLTRVSLRPTSGNYDEGHPDASYMNVTFLASVDYIDTYSILDDALGLSMDFHVTGEAYASFAIVYDHNLTDILEYTEVKHARLSLTKAPQTAQARLQGYDNVTATLYYEYADVFHFKTTWSTLDPSTERPGIDPSYPYFHVNDKLKYNFSSTPNHYSLTISIRDSETHQDYITLMYEFTRLANRTLTYTVISARDHVGVYAVEENNSYLELGWQYDSYYDVNGTLESKQTIDLAPNNASDYFYYPDAIPFNSSYPLIYQFPDHEEFFSLDFNYFSSVFDLWPWLSQVTNTTLPLVKTMKNVENGGSQTIGGTTYFFPTIWIAKQYLKTYAYSMIAVPPLLGNSLCNITVSLYRETNYFVHYQNYTKMLLDFGYHHELSMNLMSSFMFTPDGAITPRNVTYKLDLYYSYSENNVLVDAPNLIALLNSTTPLQSTTLTSTQTTLQSSTSLDTTTLTTASVTSEIQNETSITSSSPAPGELFPIVIFTVSLMMLVLKLKKQR